MAIFESAWSAVASLFDRGFDPATARKLPVADETGQSNVRGLYMAGEIAGAPLIKLGLNRGRQVIDHIVNVDLRGQLGDRAVKLDDDGRIGMVDDGGWDPTDPRGENWLDVLVIGAGCAGLGAADRCQQLSLRYVVIEAQRPAQLVRNMTRGKPLFMEPPNEQNQTRLFCEECRKETLLEHWDRQLAELGIDDHIRNFETVRNIQRLSDQDGFKVTTDKATYEARRVVLAIGKAGNPRKLNVTGELEHADRISQNVADPDVYQDRDLVVFGAGDVACEAAIVLADGGNHVSLVAPDRQFTFPKQRNIDGVARRAGEGKIDVYLNHVAESIGPDAVTVRHAADGSTRPLAAHHVFRCIGAEMPMKFFRQVGIKLEGAWDVRRWVILSATFAVCYFIYGSKSSPALWPFNIDAHLFAGHGSEARSFADWWKALGIGEGRWAFKLNGSFWYSLAYCVVMTVFGLKAYHRWGVRHDDDYQKKRFATLIVVQWTLAFLVPMVLMWAVHGLWPNNAVLGDRDRWWHASGFEYAFPLFFWQFFWDVGWLYLVYGLAATFVVIPILTIRHGKRYCTWFCGCGGLAETLGDPWRHLAHKGKISQRWEWMNMAVLLWAVLAAALVVGKIGLGKWITGTPFEAPSVAKHGVLTAGLFSGYQVVADIWLVGIIPVALYPIYGGKVWCRYWCPLAKWMQLTSRWFGTLQISSNEKCITCGECSRYCEVGIDVMAFAKNAEPFSNEQTSCIQCGICVTVCPMDVLSFDNEHRGTLTRKLFPLERVTVEGAEVVGVRD